MRIQHIHYFDLPTVAKLRFRFTHIVTVDKMLFFFSQYTSISFSERFRIFGKVTKPKSAVFYKKRRLICYCRCLATEITRFRIALKRVAEYLRSLEKYGNKFGQFPTSQSLEKCFWSVKNGKIKIIFRFDLLTCIFIIFYPRLYNFTFIVFTIIIPVFDLGMSFGKVKSGKSRKGKIQHR